MAHHGNMKSNASDVDTWRNPSGLLVALFRFSKNRHVAHSNWFTLFQGPTLLTINSAIPLLTSHISHIFFSDISHPALHLGVSFHP